MTENNIILYPGEGRKERSNQERLNNYLRNYGTIIVAVVLKIPNWNSGFKERDKNFIIVDHIESTLQNDRMILPGDIPDQLGNDVVDININPTKESPEGMRRVIIPKTNKIIFEKSFSPDDTTAATALESVNIFVNANIQPLVSATRGIINFLARPITGDEEGINENMTEKIRSRDAEQAENANRSMYNPNISLSPLCTRMTVHSRVTGKNFGFYLENNEFQRVRESIINQDPNIIEHSDR
jgi:hypothetical protein